MLAEAVVVGEREAEEVGAVDPALDRRLLVAMAHHRQHHGDVGVDAESRRNALVPRRELVVVVDPLPASSGSTNENESAPRPRCGGESGSSRAGCTRPTAAGAAAGSGFGTTLRGGIDVPASVVAGERLLDEHPRDHVERFLPLGALASRGRRRSRPARSASSTRRSRTRPVRPEIRSRVATRSATRAGWLTRGRHLDDPVAEPDAAGALAGRGEEDLGSAGVRVLLQEVVLDLPDVVDPEPVGELDLVERVGEQRVPRRALLTRGRGSWCS